MKCLSCQRHMAKIIENFDYTRLAGRRNVTITLCDVTTHRCANCGPTATFVEIRRIADLERELVATKALRVKQLWCSFNDVEWVIAFVPTDVAGRHKKRGA